MKQTMLRAVCGLLLCSGLAVAVSAAGNPQQKPYRPNAVDAEAPVTKEGWWIRVTPANVATNVSWRFGAQRNRLSDPLRWWKDEYPVEFDVPAVQRGLPTLHVAAFGIPYQQTVSFCVFFRDRGAKHLEFTGEKVEAVNQDDQDAACTP